MKMFNTSFVAILMPHMHMTSILPTMLDFPGKNIFLMISYLLLFSLAEATISYCLIISKLVGCAYRCLKYSQLFRLHK